MTRIPLRSLERLEAGAFDRQPDGFARGFVRTVAQAIGLDADDAVARMLTEPEAGPGAAWPDPRRLALVLAALLVVLLVSLALVSRPDPAPSGVPPEEAPPPLVRRDAVRALAEARGLWPPAPTQPTPDASTPDPSAPALESPGGAPADATP